MIDVTLDRDASRDHACGGDRERCLATAVVSCYHKSYKIKTLPNINKALAALCKYTVVTIADRSVVMVMPADHPNSVVMAVEHVSDW